MTHSPTYIVLGFLIPQALVCTAAVIFLRKSRSVGAIVFLAGMILSLISLAATTFCPTWNQHYGFTDFSYRLWWVLRTGFSYTGTNLYAIGLLIIALKQRKSAQQSHFVPHQEKFMCTLPDKQSLETFMDKISETEKWIHKAVESVVMGFDLLQVNRKDKLLIKYHDVLKQVAKERLECEQPSSACTKGRADTPSGRADVSRCQKR